MSDDPHCTGSGYGAEAANGRTDRHGLHKKNFESDRAIGRLASRQVADLMRDDQLYPLNTINFAPDADGSPKLVDGQVLLEAALATGWNEP